MSLSSSINTSLEDHLSQIDDSISLTQTPQEQQQQQQEQEEIEIDISSPKPEDYPKPRWQLRKRAIPLFPPSKKGRQQKTPILSPLSSATPAISPSPAGTRPPTKFVAATGAGPSSVAGGGAGAGPSSVAGGGTGAGPSSAAGGGSSGAGSGSSGAGGGGSSGAGGGSSGAGGGSSGGGSSGAGGGSSGAGGGSSGAGGGSSGAGGAGGGSSGAGGGSSGAAGSAGAAGPIPPRGPRRQRGPRGRRNHPRSNHPYHQPTVNVSLPVYTPKQITRHSYINSLYTAWISHPHLPNIIIVPNCYTWTPTCFCKHEYFWHTFLTRHAANFGLVYTISLLHRSFRGSSTPIIVPRPYFSACATLAPPHKAATKVYQYIYVRAENACGSRVRIASGFREAQQIC